MELINQPPKVKPVSSKLILFLAKTMLLTKVKNMLILLIMIFRVIIHISTGEGSMPELMLELAWAMMIGNVFFIITGMFSKSLGVDMSERSSFVGMSGFALVLIYPIYNQIILENTLLINLLMGAITLGAIWYLKICANEMDLVTYLMGPEPEKEETNLNNETNNSLNV